MRLHYLILHYLIIMLLLASSAGATSVDICNDHPNSAVILVVDGLGAPYVLPDQTPHAIDGKRLPQAHWPLHDAFYASLKVPKPSTPFGHSVLATGYSGATPEVVGFENATLYDAFRREGFLIVGVMETGDFAEMRCEHDVILYAPGASITNPAFQVDTHRPTPVEFRTGGPNYDGVEGIERYVLYNRWAMDQAVNAVDVLHGQRFILTVNVGAVDAAAHYYGPSEYAYVLDSLWPDVQRLKRACGNDTILIVTSDHGMAFGAPYTRGGHSGSRYKDRVEANTAPLIIFGPQEKNLVGEYGQEDVAPTILDLLGVPGGLPYADGRPMNLSNHHRLRITTPGPRPVHVEGPVSTTLEGSQEYMVYLPGGSYKISTMGENATVNVTADTNVNLGSDLEFKRIAPESPGRVLLGLGGLLAVNGMGAAAIFLIRRGRV